MVPPPEIDLQAELEAAQLEIAKLSSLIDASQTINSTLELDEVLERILLTATEKSWSGSS